MSMLHLEVTRGVWGANPPVAEEIFFKKCRLFLIFFAFWQGSLNLQNYELAP